MQVLEQAIKETGSLDDGKLAEYIRDHTFKTVVGDVSFGKDGEWAYSPLVWTQFQGIENNELAQFMDTSKEIVLLPKIAQSGTLITPYQAGSR